MHIYDILLFVSHALHTIHVYSTNKYVILESYTLMKEREPTGINLLEAFAAFITGQRQCG